LWGLDAEVSELGCDLVVISERNRVVVVFVIPDAFRQLATGTVFLSVRWIECIELFKGLGYDAHPLPKLVLM
jgi:hypothetical protein